MTICSDSEVVKPAPLSAERAWNRAVSRERPVRVSATVATRVISTETATTSTTVRAQSTDILNGSGWRPRYATLGGRHTYEESRCWS